MHTLTVKARKERRRIREKWTIFRELVLRDDEPHLVSRLFHRSLTKYLSGKEDAGAAIANETVASLKYGEEISKDDYQSVMRKLLDRFSEKYPMEKGYEELLRKMLGRVSR